MQDAQLFEPPLGEPVNNSEHIAEKIAKLVSKLRDEKYSDCSSPCLEAQENTTVSKLRSH